MLYWKNKEIFEMKLSITTDCVLRCDYCFVNKERKNSKMNLKIAKKAIDFFLNSGGKEKVLKIYGGEPLLNFETIKKIVPYTIKQAQKEKINLTLSLCTNAILLKPEYIDFFKKYKFQLAISFDGNKETHNKFRKFPDGSGSFNIVKKNLQYLFKKIDKKNVAANMAIAPSEVGKMFKNFQYILNTGFDTLNLEPIHGFQKWTPEKQRKFEEEMKKIIDFIVKEIYRGNFYFLTTINRELKYKTLTKLKEGVCMFHQFLEIYPAGEMGFSSFFFNLLEKKQKKYIIGNVAEEKIKSKYKNCSYSKNSEQCQKCYDNYFDIPDESLSSKIVKIRNLFSIDIANEIQDKAKSNRFFKDYVKEAKKHICF